MRRSFNKDILPQSAPVRSPVTARKKTLRCADLSILLTDYKLTAGKKFSFRHLARACGVAPITCKKWTYGYCPHPLIWWNIARYFEPLIDVPAEIIKKDIENTIQEWKRSKK